MGYSAVELDNGAACLAGMAAEARRRAGSNFLLDNRWFPPTAYVREDAARLDESSIRAVILIPAGKGWIVYFQMGHESRDFENRSLLQMIDNALRWQP